MNTIRLFNLTRGRVFKAETSMLRIFNWLFLFETVAPALSSLRKMSTTPLAAAQQNYSINHFYFNITSSKGSIVSTVFGSVLKVLVEVLVSLTTYLDIEFLF